MHETYFQADTIQASVSRNFLCGLWTLFLKQLVLDLTIISRHCSPGNGGSHLSHSPRQLRPFLFVDFAVPLALWYLRQLRIAFSLQIPVLQSESEPEKYWITLAKFRLMEDLVKPWILQPQGSKCKWRCSVNLGNFILPKAYLQAKLKMNIFALHEGNIWACNIIQKIYP